MARVKRKVDDDYERRNKEYKNSAKPKICKLR